MRVRALARCVTPRRGLIYGAGVLAVAGFLLARFRREPAPPAEPVALRVELTVEGEDGRPLPSRVHLRDAAGTVHAPKDQPAYDDHFVFPGRTSLALAPGFYHYEVERGPEYARATGGFEVRPEGAKPVTIRLPRRIDLDREGYYAGDLHSHRKREHMALLAEAEDLDIAPVITWWNGQPPDGALPGSPLELAGPRFIDASAGEDERQGGALLYLRAKQALPLPTSVVEDGRVVHRAGDERDELPTMSELARVARRDPRVHIDVEKPFWWDMPAWVALGLADSLGIAHNHMNRSRVHASEAWGRPCDRSALGDGTLANGECTQLLYYRLLDAGVRLAPSAGSASGALENPVGYNRVYVHVEGRLDYDAWLDGLKSGRSFVTNGPILLVRANGKHPGHVFREADVELEARVLSNDELAAVELVRDGRVIETATYDRASGLARFTPQRFERSGWFLVRARTSRTDTYRFASTAPFYVELGEAPRRISERAVTFFAKWVDERMLAIRSSAEASPELEVMLAPQLAAQSFWRAQLASANAD